MREGPQILLWLPLYIKKQLFTVLTFPMSWRVLTQKNKILSSVAIVKTNSLAMVIGEVNSYWSKAIGHRQARSRFHMTLIRKYAVTKTHNFQPNFENDLAKLICNSWEMRKQTYCLEEKCKNISNQSTAQDYCERVKVNCKTFLVQYNRCVQLKLLMVKPQLLL